jgi:hypothetical protein
MIERLITTLSSIATRSPTELAGPDSELLLADCADAVRLEVDCPQQDLTPEQRSALEHLGDVLGDFPVAPDRISAAATRACAALGLSP